MKPKPVSQPTAYAEKLIKKKEALRRRVKVAEATKLPSNPRGPHVTGKERIPSWGGRRDPGKMREVLLTENSTTPEFKDLTPTEQRKVKSVIKKHGGMNKHRVDKLLHEKGGLKKARKLLR